MGDVHAVCGGLQHGRWFCGGVAVKDILFVVALVAVIICFFAGQTLGLAKGYNEGFEAGKAEAQTPAFIVETCSAWWWGSNKEATKMLKKYCEMKK